MVKVALGKAISTEEKLDSVHPDDKQFFGGDGCFRTKCMRSPEQDAHLALMNGLKEYEKMWVNSEAISILDAKYKSIKDKNPKEYEDRQFSVIDNEGKRSPYPITDVFGGACRHDTVARLAYMTSGEGFKYILTMIDEIKMDETRNVPLYIIYDLVCKLRPDLESLMPQLLANEPKLALSAFHAYAHSPSCQCKFNPKLIDGFGKTDGEGLERLWSYLFHFITMVKPMTVENFKFVLYMAIEYRNELIKRNMASTIKKKAERLFIESRELNDEVSSWTTQELLAVHEKYQANVEDIGSVVCNTKDIITNFFPPGAESKVRYYLLLSILFRFNTMLPSPRVVTVESTGEKYVGDRINDIDKAQNRRAHL